MTVSEFALEFSRPIAVDRLSSVEFVEAIEADSGERARLAERFGLVSLDRLDASVRIRRREGGNVRVAGQLAADIVQTCVITLEPFPSHIEDSFTVEYTEAPPEAKQDLSLDLEYETPEPIEGGIIDVGELVAQHLSLALDPHPRAPGAELDQRWSDSGQNEPSPFAVLEKLKREN
ncbi:MAG TPA: DUF177 domain-containing protein [Alphaproteobacteria bacterium]|nr:DUF177 domain-containing protein [Alphaproteobacteria bacterium]